ncbi:hypothetical protein BX600DRAFT_471851 [Xylariales sp. PMI_506]|nr:hypothetical protein BX600DRAFT_471851 [Xylariales sp. PMI_506]
MVRVRILKVGGLISDGDWHRGSRLRRETFCAVRRRGRDAWVSRGGLVQPVRLFPPVVDVVRSGAHAQRGSCRTLC